MPEPARSARPAAKADGPVARPRTASGLTPRIYAIMALTTCATFATLEAIRQLFFTHSVFA